MKVFSFSFSGPQVLSLLTSEEELVQLFSGLITVCFLWNCDQFKD